MKTYDRYSKFKSNGQISIIPFINIPVLSTDAYETYEQGISRLDILSQQYYDNPNYGWLILQANPSLGSMEFEIPNYSQIRIPYPLSTVLANYEASIDNYITQYGIQ